MTGIAPKQRNLLSYNSVFHTVVKRPIQQCLLNTSSCCDDINNVIISCEITRSCDPWGSAANQHQGDYNIKISKLHFCSEVL